MTKGLGWIPDLPDQRDYAYTPISAVLPSSVDLRSQDTPIYDQGNLGSCTANAIAAHLDFNRKKQGEQPITPSRLFIYYNERKDQGTIASDSGASIRESVKAVKNYGACPETEWPYSRNFEDQPPKNVYADAVKYEALSYQRVKRGLINLKSCLVDGFPFVIGITVYDSFHQADNNGVVPLPSPGDQVLGGHAVMVVGYQSGAWICRNSWGSSWGDKGYFYLPEKYLLNNKLSSDFWTLRQVS